MRVFINSRFLTQEITGVQRYAIEISKQIKKLSPETIFIAPKNIIHQQLAKNLEVQTFGKWRGHLWEQIELPEYLKHKGHPLLVNLANTAPLFYKNQVITIHDLSFLRNPKWFSRKIIYYYKFLIPKIINRSLKIITVSNFSKHEIMHLGGVEESKIKVIYDAVPEAFSRGKEKESRNIYGNYVLAVTSLEPRKNLKNLMLAYFKTNLRDVKLLVVGTENKIFGKKEVKKIINPDKNVVFAGRVSDEDLIGLYKNAKLFVYPSFYEGFGLPPLEAMACDCPVVVSNVASLPEVCGDAAYYVDPYNVNDIAEGICRVVMDEELRKSLIQKGLERVKMFSWAKSAREYLKVFEEILNS